MKTEQAAQPIDHAVDSEAASFPHYRGLIQAIFAGAFVFGVVMASLGALLPGLIEKIGFDKASAGTLFLAMNFAMLVGSLVFGPVCDLSFAKTRSNFPFQVLNMLICHHKFSDVKGLSVSITRRMAFSVGTAKEDGEHQTERVVRSATGESPT